MSHASTRETANRRPLVCLTCDHMETDHHDGTQGATPECYACGPGHEWHTFRGTPLPLPASGDYSEGPE